MDSRVTTRAGRSQRRPNEIRSAGSSNVQAQQFQAISNRFQAVLAIGAGLYLLQLFLVTFYSTSLLGEDGPVETATAILFLCGGLIALRTCLNDRGRAMSIAMTTIAFIGFLDELSFGERLLQYEALVIRGVRLDAIHDAPELVYSVIVDKFAIWQMTLIGSLVVAVAVISTWGHHAWLRRIWNCSRTAPFLAMSLACVGLALLVDEGFENTFLSESVVIASLEEICELLAAAAVLCAVAVHGVETSVLRPATFSTKGSTTPASEL